MAKKPKDPNKPKKTGRQPGKPRTELEAPPPAVVAAALQDTVDDLADPDSAQADVANELDALPPQGKRTPQQEALALAFEGWRALKPKQQIRAARSAILLDPDCADAIRLLARNENDPQHTHALYADAIAAAERSLGAAAIAEYSGRFWQVVETRPLMRALDDAAFDALENGNPAHAVTCWSRMLELDPSDSLGVHRSLATALLSDGTAASHAALRALFGRFPQDDSAAFTFSRALLFFREQGAGAAADRAAQTAVKANPFVTDSLAGNGAQKAAPEDIDLLEEAIEYAEHARAPWSQTRGALEWLQSTTL